MNIIEIIFTSLALSMDSFAMSVTMGLSQKKYKIKNSFLCGIWFGSFQAIMPIFGFLMCFKFLHYIKSIDHWISFILLFIIGLNMLLEPKQDENKNLNISFKSYDMLLLSIATAIDALAVGITFAFLNVNIYVCSFVIGIITFLMCFVGVKIGNLFGKKYSSFSQVLGGFILIITGFKILFEHINIT